MTNKPQPRKVCRKCWTTHAYATGPRAVCPAERKPRHTPEQMAYMLHLAAKIRDDEEARSVRG